MGRRSVVISTETRAASLFYKPSPATRKFDEDVVESFGRTSHLYENRARLAITRQQPRRIGLGRAT